MKNTWIYLGIFIALAGCHQTEDTGFAASTTQESGAHEQERADAPQAPLAKTPDPAAAGSAGAPAQKQFIRTADARFKVKSVTQTTARLEQTLARLGGYVSQNNTRSQVKNSRTIETSPDSSLLLTEYHKEGTLVLRVPNQHLDSLVRTVAKHVVFLDHHTVTADEVSLQLLQQALAQKRQQEYVARLSSAIKQKPAKLPDAASAEDARLSRQQQADAALLARLGIQDRVDYSTVNLTLYENSKLSRELVINPEAANRIRPYEPGFLARLALAAAEGWYVLEWLLLGLMRLWGVLLLIALSYACFLWLRRWQAQP